MNKNKLTSLFSKSFSTCTRLQSTGSSSSSSSTSSTNGATRTDLNSNSLNYLKSINNLKLFDPSLDLPKEKHFQPKKLFNQTFNSSIVLIQDEVPYQQIKPSLDLIETLPGEDDSISHLSSITQLSSLEIKSLFRFPLIMKRVVNMKSKGKMPSMYSLVVVGNGKGLVGVGEGKDDTANKAVSKAFNQAVRSMDYVERYEDRTVFGTMDSTFGSCKIQMRSRPPGFGLRVNHYIHQVAKAAGISDLSAKVYGSNNGTRVVKLAISMLHGGTPSLDMGSFGVKGQRKNKLSKGMESAESIGRNRGRKSIVI